MNIPGVHGLGMGIGPTVPVFNRSEPVVRPKQQNPRNKEAISYFGDNGGCGWWRMGMPEMMVNYSKLGNVTTLHKLIPDSRFYDGIRSVRLQRQASPEHADFFAHLKNIANKEGFKIIYEIDDIIFKEDIPDFNRAKFAFDSEQIRHAIVFMMNNADVVTVTCDYMKEYYESHLDHSNIKVVPNMPSRMWLDGMYSSQEIMQNYNDTKNRPRVLYAGSGNHFDVEKKGVPDDFTHVNDAIIKNIKNFKWVFLGSIPEQLKRYVDSGDIEFYPWAMILNYPKAIHNLKVNAVVAPLMDCTFNKAKSNIKFLESACLGIPGVFQDIVTYQDAPLKFTDGNDMIKKLEKLLADRKYYAKMSKRSRMYADTMWLDDNIDVYTDLYFN